MAVPADDSALAPGLFGRVVAGAAGGVAGGIGFGILMQATGTIPMVAQLVGRESLLVGWTVHMSIAVFVGVSFAVIFGLFAVTMSLSALLGAFYGLVWWVLGGLTLMPLWLGMGLFAFDSAAWQSLAGHLLYGLLLGMLYAVAAGALVRDWRRAWARLRGRFRTGEVRRRTLSTLSWRRRPDPLVWTPPPLLVPARRTVPGLAPLRSGLTPLPPQARALRERHRPRGA